MRFRPTRSYRPKDAPTRLVWVDVGDGMMRALSAMPGGTYRYEIAPIGEISWVLTADRVLLPEPHTHWSRAALMDKAEENEWRLKERRT